MQQDIVGYIAAVVVGGGDEERFQPVPGEPNFPGLIKGLGNSDRSGRKKVVHDMESMIFLPVLVELIITGFPACRSYDSSGCICFGDGV